MTREQATEILVVFNEWRRYDGPFGEGPIMPCPKEIGQALDTAIAILQSKEIPQTENTIDVEFLKKCRLYDECDVPNGYGGITPGNFVRACNICRWVGINTVYDLAGWPRNEIMKLRNCGKKSFYWLENVLRKYGLTWGMWESESYLEHKKRYSSHDEI